MKNAQIANSQFRFRDIFTKPVIYALLTISGLSCCFFLGFPFDNHNESFLWIVAFNKVSLWDTLTKQVIGIETFRPLGMATAWLGYHLSGNIYLQQLINWIFAACSFLLLFYTARNKILFSLISFVAGACFFAGYIYLFHLHGVFYGPFQLYVALLTAIGWRQQSLSSRMLLLTGFLTIIVCLFHTFALLVFCSFLAGYLVQPRKAGKRTNYAGPAIALVLTLGLATIILHAKELKSLQALINGLVVSFKMAEVASSLSVIAMLLSILAAIPILTAISHKLILCSLVALLSLLFIYWQLPVLMIWVAVCAINMVVAGNRIIAALIAGTALLPMGSSSGSPTYVVFVLMICSFVTASATASDIRDRPALRKLSLAGVLLLTVCLLFIKKGVRVPLLCTLARPILAEQEKTQQFKDIVEWKLTTQLYEPFGLQLYDPWVLPINSTNSIDRMNRPVTEQAAVDAYLHFFSNGTYNNTKNSVLYVTFGDEILNEKKLVFSVAGKWNGRANVFR
jgi:hypothetical protein